MRRFLTLATALVGLATACRSPETGSDVSANGETSHVEAPPPAAVGSASAPSTGYQRFGPEVIKVLKEQLARLPDSSIWVIWKDSEGHRWNRFFVGLEHRSSDSFPAFGDGPETQRLTAVPPDSGYYWYGSETIKVLREQVSRLPDNAIWATWPDEVGRQWNQFLLAPDFKPSAAFLAFEESHPCPPVCAKLKKANAQ